MPSLLRVDFSALENLLSTIVRTIDSIDATLDNLDSQVTSLSSTWTGNASQGYQNTIANWTTNTADLRDQLKYLHRLVSTAHSNHSSASRTNTKIWQV